MTERPSNLVAAVDGLRTTGRRTKVPEGECAYCDGERTAGRIFHPPHDASANCESGKHPHCSCDTCF